MVSVSLKKVDPHIENIDDETQFHSKKKMHQLAKPLERSKYIDLPFVLWMSLCKATEIHVYHSKH